MNDLIFKAANVIHRTVVSLSGGRLGGDVLNMPVLELTTTGAKSGQKRTAMLTTPVQEGDTIGIVASCGGDAHHPAWFHNLKTNPNVEVSLRGGILEFMVRCSVMAPLVDGSCGVSVPPGADRTVSSPARSAGGPSSRLG